MEQLPDPYRWKRLFYIWWLLVSAILVTGAFFLGAIFLNGEQLRRFVSPTPKIDKNTEVFGFAPYWNLSKLNNIDWKILTSFAYFSLPVDENGDIDKTSYEWTVFEGKKLANIFKTAEVNGVKKIVTLTQMEKPVVESFLDNPDAWENLAYESADILDNKKLDGVNIDFEYMASDSYYRQQFSQFITTYSRILKEKKADAYLTVSVLASSERFSKIYDIGVISRESDGVVMMAYDFYYPGSDAAGPTAPLYGYNEGRGPFWYDVSTAVADFLKVAESNKIILGVPYYGWNYPASTPKPLATNVSGAVATTNEKAQSENLIKVTPIGGWDDQAKVSWRGYWDGNGWRIVYLEDKKSLSFKYDLVKGQKLKGVGIWALGYDNGDDELWAALREKFPLGKGLANLNLNGAFN